MRTVNLICPQCERKYRRRMTSRHPRFTWWCTNQRCDGVRLMRPIFYRYLVNGLGWNEIAELLLLRLNRRK